MGFGENLISLRNLHDISRKELAEKLDIPYTTLRNYETNQREPGHKLLIQLAQMFSVSVDFLIGCNTDTKNEAPSDLPEEALKVAKDYTALSDHGKGAVKAILEYEVKDAALKDEPAKIEAPAIVPLPKAKKRRDGFTEIKVYDQPAAAGLGNYLDDPDYHIEQYPPEVIPDDTDFGIIISGDSMEPKVHDGGTVFVQAAPSIDPGKIGVFVLNGLSYCKKLVVDRKNRQIRLASINRAYDDIVITEFDEFRTIGRVLGQWTRGHRQDLFGW